jgi:hypothetical protein
MSSAAGGGATRWDAAVDTPGMVPVIELAPPIPLGWKLFAMADCNSALLMSSSSSS